MDSKTCPGCNYENIVPGGHCSECGCHLEANPSNDEKKIYREVVRKKKRAKDLRLPGVLWKLYSEKIRFYPEWMKSAEKRSFVCPLVTNAESTEPDLRLNWKRSNKTKFTLKGREYLFEFNEKDLGTPDGVFFANLILFEGEKKVFDICMTSGEGCDDYMAGNMELTQALDASKWGGFGVEAFVEGVWVNEFKELDRKVAELNRQEFIEHKQSEEKKIESDSAAKRDQLKKDFGL